MWSFSGGVTSKCCSSIFFFINLNIYKYKTSLLSKKKNPISCSTNLKSAITSIKIITKKLLSTKWQWVFFFYKFQKVIPFERSKKKKSLLKVVLDQLYQLMVFETPSDHYFPRSSFRQNFGRPPKKKR